jgi:hypothetical protein
MNDPLSPGPQDRPIEPQTDNPDIVRPARETPDDRGPFKVFGNILALLLVIGGVYLAYSYYKRASIAHRAELTVASTTR